MGNRHGPEFAESLVVGSPCASKSGLFAPALVVGGLVAALFAGTFLHLAELWASDAGYSHGYLVAPISLVLAIRAFRTAGPRGRGEVAFGLLGIAFGVACQLTATLLRWPPLSFVALFAVGRGVLVTFGGRRWASAFTFPLLFLFFMFPLPVTWTGYAALWLQDVVSRVSEAAVGLFVVCHRVGHSIRVAGVDQPLVVAEGCSGLGQIVAFVACATLLGHLFGRPMWYRVLLVLAAVPVAVVANTLRVVLLTLGVSAFGADWLKGPLHDAPALFTTPLGVVLFLLIDRLASRSQQEPIVSSSLAPDSGPLTPGTCPPLALAVALLLAAVSAQLALAAHLRTAGELSFPPQAGPLDALPRDLPPWAGADLPESKDAIRTQLPFRADDLLVRNYRHAGGADVQLYAVHSWGGEDRKHHPEICIRDVSGAPEDLAFRARVPLAAGAEAQRFRFQTGVGRSVVVYYWHYTVRPVDDPNRTRLQSIHLRLGMAAPSVTVQVTAGTDDPRVLASVERELLPALDRAARSAVLPPNADAGCDRVPVGLARR